jgi:hypothetical protein
MAGVDMFVSIRTERGPLIKMYSRLENRMKKVAAKKARKTIKERLKEERDKALNEAITVCDMWKKEVEIEFDREKLKGNLSSYGKINILDLCIQRIKEKITGVREWS